MKMNIVIEGSKQNIAKFEAMAALFDIKVTLPEEVETVVEQPKAEKETTKSGNGWTEAQKAEYRKIAKELGCLGKGGVWKACRKYCYAVMDGSMTKAKAKKAVKDFANEKGWKLTNAR